jgi:hypothetical protein
MRSQAMRSQAMRSQAMRTACLGSALALGIMLAPSGGEAQQPPRPGAGPPAAQPDTVDLIFEREVFDYPAFQRRNPFRPLTGDDAGPRFEELVLLGVILSDDRAGSVALLAPRQGTGTRDAGGRNWRVREGDLLGNMRILAIQQREIRVEVDEFGVREARVLELRRTEPRAEGEDEAPDGADGSGEDEPAPPPGGGGDPGAPPDTAGVPDGNGRNGGSA